MDKVLDKIGEAVAAKLTLTDEFDVVTYPFVDRWHVGFNDDEFIEKNEIAEGEPYLSIYGSPVYTRSWALVRSERTVSDITHQGSSTLDFELTGEPQGVNDYVLEIVQSGAFGIAIYKLSNDGGDTFGDDTLTPLDGKLIIGDGTKLEFSGAGNLVAGDTYSWETESSRDETYRSYEFNGIVALEIVAGSRDEFFGVVANDHVGYHDQLIALFSEKSGIVIDDFSWVRMIMDRSPTAISDSRVEKYRGLVTITVEGELYITRTVPIAEVITVEPVVS